MAVGASEAVEVLFREHYSPLVGLGIVLTGERELAEDLAQESFAVLLRTWNNLRDESAAPSYLRSTMVNLSRSALRRRRVRMLRAPQPTPPSSGLQDSADRLTLQWALLRVPYRQRACVALRYFEGLSVGEVAKVMGTSEGTVKSQTHKALRRLQQLVEE
jgi:RNA polymerase sigma-70 factor (sigma-E family)